MITAKPDNMACASGQEVMVSIVCITYNQEPYIAQALDGFLMQETTFPIEIIVHDDASTDKTAEIIREYERKHPDLFVCLLQKENQYTKCPYSVLEVPFTKARGKYIALCEGDDYWIDPHKLQKQVYQLEANEEYSMCFHNAQIIYDDKSQKDRLFCSNFFDNQIFETSDFILRDWFCPTASMVFKKASLPIYPGWAKRVQSADFTLQLFLSTNGSAVYINETMSVYRGNALNSLSSVKRKATFYIDALISLLHNFNEATCYKYKKSIIRRTCRLYMLIPKTIISSYINRFNIYKSFKRLLFVCKN